MTWLFGCFAALILAGCGQVGERSNTLQIQMAIYTPLCLEVTGASVTEGEPVETYPCVAGERRQEWSFVPVAGSTGFQIVNTNSLQCMTVSYGNPAPSTPVVQAPCYALTPASQVWSYVPSPGVRNAYQILSAVSGLCLDIPEGATVGTTPMQVYTCNPLVDPAQAFVLNAVAYGSTP